MVRVPSPPRSSRRLSRGEKWLYIGCTLLVLGLMSAAWFNAARETDPVINFAAPLPIPRPNGYGLYVRAEKAITPTTIPVDPVDDASPPTTAKDRAQRYSLARHRAWLNANSAGFALFEQAIRTPCVYPQKRGSPSSMITSAALRQLARNLTKRTNTLKMEGHWSAAAQSGLDTVQMGGDIARGGPMLAKLVGSAVLSIGLSPLTDFDDVPEHLNAWEARAATKRLENIVATTPTFVDAVREDRWNALAQFLNFIKQPQWRSSGDTNFGGTPPTWREKLTARLISKREVASRINEQFDLLEHDLTSPYSAPSHLTPQATDILSQQFGLLISLRRNHAREQVGLRILLLRFALQAYQAEHGAYPASLSALIPNYLQRMPTDTYADEKPFHYKRTGKTYKLWSVGPDSVDNGGTPIPPSNSRPLFPGEKPHPAWVLPKSKGDWVAGKNR